MSQSVQSGQVEIVGSYQEQIGLQNWSQVQVLVAAKRQVAQIDYDLAFATLQDIAADYGRAQVERITQSLSMQSTPPHEPTQQPWPALNDPSSAATPVELTFSVTERVSLPSSEKGQNHSVNLLASAKTLSQAGGELEALEWLAAGVKRQMSKKRDDVIAHPREWAS